VAEKTNDREEEVRNGRKGHGRKESMKESKAIENIYWQSHHDGNTSGVSVTHLVGTRDKFRRGKWLFVTSYNFESRFRCFGMTGYLHLQFGTLNMDPAVFFRRRRYLRTKLHGVTAYTTFISILTIVIQDMVLQNYVSLSRQIIVSKSIHS